MTFGGWTGTCTTTRRYPVLKTACGLAAAVERTNYAQAPRYWFPH